MYGIIPALRAARGLILIVDIGTLPHRRTSQAMGVFALRFGFWQQGRDAQQSGATNDPVMSRARVLLQSTVEGKDGAISSCSQAATSNSDLTKAAWATMSSPPIRLTCPFLIIASVS